MGVLPEHKVCDAVIVLFTISGVTVTCFTSESRQFLSDMAVKRMLKVPSLV